MLDPLDIETMRQVFINNNETPLWDVLTDYNNYSKASGRPNWAKISRNLNSNIREVQVRVASLYPQLLSYSDLPLDTIEDIRR